MKKNGRKGYTLVELLVVIAIIAILSAVSTGIYSGYVEKAKKARYYELAHQIRQALAVCELEYGGTYGLTSEVMNSDPFFLPPNDPDSVLYPYVGELAEDCVSFSLKFQKVRETQDGEELFSISGFTYESELYLVRFSDPEEITVERK